MGLPKRRGTIAAKFARVASAARTPPSRRLPARSGCPALRHGQRRWGWSRRGFGLWRSGPAEGWAGVRLAAGGGGDSLLRLGLPPASGGDGTRHRRRRLGLGADLHVERVATAQPGPKVDGAVGALRLRPRAGRSGRATGSRRLRPVATRHPRASGGGAGGFSNPAAPAAPAAQPRQEPRPCPMSSNESERPPTSAQVADPAEFSPSDPRSSSYPRLPQLLDVAQLVVDPVPRIPRVDDLLQPLRPAAFRSSGSIVSAR